MVLTTFSATGGMKLPPPVCLQKYFSLLSFNVHFGEEDCLMASSVRVIFTIIGPGFIKSLYLLPC